MGATNRFSEAAWELQTAFLKPPEECKQIFRRLQKSYLQLPCVRIAVNTTARGFRKICENSKAFCKKENKTC
jgi:hypothetical protein